MEDEGLERREIAYQCSELLCRKQLVSASALFCLGFGRPFPKKMTFKGSSRAVVLCRTDLFIAGKVVTGLSWGVSPRILIVTSSEIALTFWYSEISLSRIFCPCMMGLGLF